VPRRGGAPGAGHARVGLWCGRGGCRSGVPRSINLVFWWFSIWGDQKPRHEVRLLSQTPPPAPPSTAASATAAVVSYHRDLPVRPPRPLAYGSGLDIRRGRGRGRGRDRPRRQKRTPKKTPTCRWGQAPARRKHRVQHLLGPTPARLAPAPTNRGAAADMEAPADLRASDRVTRARDLRDIEPRHGCSLVGGSKSPQEERKTHCVVSQNMFGEVWCRRWKESKKCLMPKALHHPRHCCGHFA